MLEVYIEEHKVEFCGSGSGSIDPWTGKKANELGVSLWGTSDMAEFARVDEEDIYKLSSYGNSRNFKIAQDRGEIKTYEDLLKWLELNSEHKESYKENLEWLKARKEKEDERRKAGNSN